MANKKTDNTLTTRKELLVAVALTLTLGVAGGYVAGASTNSDNDVIDSTSQVSDSESGHSHSDIKFEVSAEEAPTVDIVVTEDAKSGYNVKIMTTDFTFTPENVNGDNVVGEGHAHLYVDGEKIGRLYGPDYHYDGQFEGTKEFKLTLNANDHSEYAVDGSVITATVDVTHDSNSADHDDMHMDGDKTMSNDDVKMKMDGDDSSDM